MRRNTRNLLLTTALVLAIVGSISVRREYHDHVGEVAHTHHSHAHQFAEHPSETSMDQAEGRQGNRSWLRRPRLGEVASHHHAGYSHSGHSHPGDLPAHSTHTHPNGSEQGVGGHSHISILGWEFTAWDPGSYFFSAELPVTSDQTSERLRASRRELRTELFVGSPSLDFRDGQSGSWLMNPTLRRTRCPRPDDSHCTWLENANDRGWSSGRKPPLPPPRQLG